MRTGHCQLQGAGLLNASTEMEILLSIEFTLPYVTRKCKYNFQYSVYFAVMFTQICCLTWNLLNFKMSDFVKHPVYLCMYRCIYIYIYMYIYLCVAIYCIYMYKFIYRYLFVYVCTDLNILFIVWWYCVKYVTCNLACTSSCIIYGYEGKHAQSYIHLYASYI